MIAQEIDPNDPNTWGYFQHFAVYSPTVSPSSVVAGSGVPFVFTAELSRATDTDTVIDYELFWVTRETGETFSGGYGQLTIPAGATTATLEVLPDEAYKEVGMRYVNNPAIGSILPPIPAEDPGEDPGTIVDDGTGSSEPPAPPSTIVYVGARSVSPESISAIENTPLVFTVGHFYPAQDADILVTYELTGTAEPGVHYTAPSGQVTIPAGATTATVEIMPIFPVTSFQETITMDVTGATTTGSFSAQIAANSPQTATITASQDPELEVLGWAVSPSIVAEGAGAIVFTTTLSKASIFEVTISYTLAGTANIGVDFDTPPSILSINLDGVGVGQFVIPAGATTGTVTIQPLVDDPYTTEYNETVTFQVTGATTALGIVPRPNAPSVTATITPV